MKSSRLEVELQCTNGSSHDTHKVGKLLSYSWPSKCSESIQSRRQLAVDFELMTNHEKCLALSVHHLHDLVDCSGIYLLTLSQVSSLMPIYQEIPMAAISNAKSEPAKASETSRRSDCNSERKWSTMRCSCTSLFSALTLFCTHLFISFFFRIKH
jgi:hypothetical protein